jgi:hypothetical protein
VFLKLHLHPGTGRESGRKRQVVWGRISGGKLEMEGEWVEHLIEEPSKKEIAETHHVTVDGALDSTWFRGTIRIGDLATPINVRLKRVRHVWMCGNSARS